MKLTAYNPAELIASALIDPSAAPEITLYWDTQDRSSPGPAWRTSEDSGPLEMTGWNGDAQGMHLEDFFRGPDGAYLGPDCDGVYPVLVDA